MKKEQALKVTVAFSLLYALCMGLRVWYFLRAGKSMICEADAVEQHINALIAYGKWMRGVIYTLVHEHRLAFQNYSFGIGLGADFYTSMQYYAVGDPLNLPVVLLPSTAVYYWYQFLILLRPYLAGLSFLCLCLYRRRFVSLSLSGMTAGALIYAFSGTVLFIGMWNPFFVTPMITLPLLIRGADRLLLERRSTPFILAVFLAGVSNFYFFYMQVLFLFGYFTLRMIFSRRDIIGEAPRPFRALREVSARFLACGACGVCMGAVLLLPMFFALLDNPRAGGHAIPALYDSAYYLQLLKNLALYIYHPLHDTELALTPLSYPVLILSVVLAKRLSLRRERAELFLLTAMLLVPAAGYVMSGFSYAINRWGWCFALLTAWLSAVIWSVCPPKRKLFSAAAPAAAALFVLLNIYLADAPERGNLPNGFAERTSGADFLDRMLLTEVNALEQTVLPATDTFARYSGRHLVWNAALLHGVSSTQFYWSLANGAVADLFSELAVNDMANFSYLGFDDRAMLCDLAGVTHYTLRFDTPQEQLYVPAGFVRAADHYNFAIYENPLPMGLGAAYAQILPRSEYLTLAPYDRERALMEAAVLDDADAKTAAEAGVDAISAESAAAGQFAVLLPFSVTTGEGVRWEADDAGGRFIVENAEGGAAWISFDGTENSETALFLKGLTVDGPKDIVNIGVWALSAGALAEAEATGMDEEPTIYKTISYKTPESEFYSGWHDYLVNFGSAAGPFVWVTIEFPAAGIYTVDELAVTARRVDAFLAAREALAACATGAADLHRNPVSLMTDRVTLSASDTGRENGLLVLNIPWQRGWHARVDGERTALMRANTAFTGLLLEPGYHEIELRYRTPGLIAGAVLSAIGLAVFLWLVLLEHRDTKESKKERELPLRASTTAR